MVLDSGASQTFIHGAILESLGYLLDGPAMVIATANGSVRVPTVRISRIECLGRELLESTVVAGTLPTGIDGLLGLDFLRDHRLTIDFREGTIDLD